MRRIVTLAAVLAGLLVLTVPGAAAMEDAQLPPKLDVDAALAALEHQQIYRAPGSPARFDEAAIRRELTPNMKLLVTPFTGPYGEDGNYANPDQYRHEVHRPLSTWESERSDGGDNDFVLITVVGLKVSAGITTAVPSDLPEMRELTGSYDVTEPLLTMIHKEKSGKAPEGRFGQPTGTVEPTRAQVDELAARLRDNPVYNAPGMPYRLELPLARIRETWGFSVRVAAFPALEPGRPVVDYAPALAERFPGDVVMVVHGMWLDVAGAHETELSSAKAYAYGRFLQEPLKQGIDMENRIGSVLERAHTLLTEHPFSQPQPKPFRQVVADAAPWTLGGSALVLGAVPLARFAARRVAEAREERAAFRDASAETFAELAGLSERLLAGDHAGGAAAERYATARTLYDRASTADAMAEVREIVREGQRLLDERGTP